MTASIFRLPTAVRKFLSVSSVYANDPFHPTELDMGTPYEFIPNLPGVLILIGQDGKAVSIEACDRSMRNRAIECWKGYGGSHSVGAVRIAYDVCADPAIREHELVEEHRKTFGVLPLKNRA